MGGGSFDFDNEPSRPVKRRTSQRSGWGTYFLELLAGAFIVGGIGVMTRGPKKFPEREEVCYVGGIVLIGLGLGLVVGAARTSGFKDRVAALAPFPGTPFARVQESLGPPQVTENTRDGEVLATWALEGYKLTLAFQHGVCSRVAREEVA